MVVSLTKGEIHRNQELSEKSTTENQVLQGDVLDLCTGDSESTSDYMIDLHASSLLPHIHSLYFGQYLLNVHHWPLVVQDPWEASANKTYRVPTAWVSLPYTTALTLAVHCHHL